MGIGRSSSLTTVFSQDTEPTLNADNDFAVWVDTSDYDKSYAIFRRGSGDQVKFLLDSPLPSNSTSYDMYQRLDSLYPVADLDPTVVLEKEYVIAGSDRYNFMIYTALNPDGREWVEWHFGNWYNTSYLGGTRLIGVSRAKLYDSVRYHLDHDDGNRTGTWVSIAPTSVSDIDDVEYCIGESAETVTYTVDVRQGGGIMWEWVGVTNSGRAHIVIRDSGATEITADEYAIPEDAGNRYVDTYKNASTKRYRTVLATNLDADTYTVEVTAAGTGGGAQYRIYDRSIYSYDPNAAGDPATDPFLVDENEPTLMGAAGNTEYAARVRQASSSDTADYEYSSGTHGYESALSSMAISVDGTNVTTNFDLVTTYYGTRWLGATIDFSYDTTLITRIGSVNWATLTHEASLTRAGYDSTITRETLINTKFMQEFFGMMMAPDYENGTYTNVTFDGPPAEYYTLLTETPVAQVNHTPDDNIGSAFYSAQYATVLNVDIADPSSLVYLFTERTDGIIKDYRALVNESEFVNEVTVSSGNIYTLNCRYRCAYAPDKNFLNLFNRSVS